MRIQITHNSFKLYKKEIFDGIGPSSPLECISLQEDKFLEVKKINTYYKKFKNSKGNENSLFH